MSGAAHVLIVTTDHTGDPGDITWTLQCPGVSPACEAWEECGDPRCAADRRAAAKAVEQLRGEWPGHLTLDQLAWFEGHDVESHGVTHRHLDGMWCRPTGRCLSRCDCIDDALVDDTARDLGPGRHEVDVEYDDDVNLLMIEARS